MTKKQGRGEQKTKNIVENVFERKSDFLIQPARVVTLNIDLLYTEKQIRDEIDTESESFQQLKETIKTHGLIQPIVVLKTSKGFRIIAGERRYLACKELGLKQVNVVVHQNLKDNEVTEIQFIENLAREDLTYYQKATALINIIINRIEKDNSYITIEDLIDFCKSHSIQIPDNFLNKINNHSVEEKTLIKYKTYSEILFICLHKLKNYPKLAEEEEGKRFLALFQGLGISYRHIMRYLILFLYPDEVIQFVKGSQRITTTVLENLLVYKDEPFLMDLLKKFDQSNMSANSLVIEAKKLKALNETKKEKTIKRVRIIPQLKKIDKFIDDFLNADDVAIRDKQKTKESILNLINKLQALAEKLEN